MTISFSPIVQLVYPERRKVTARRTSTVCWSASLEFASVTDHRTYNLPATLEERIERGRWVPACGGTEEPYRTRSGILVMYVWHTGTGEHAYLDVLSDIIMTPAEAEAAHGWRM